MARSRRSSASPAATSSRRATCSRTSASATTTRPDLGTVKLDNMDTIYKEYGQVEEIFGLTSGNFISPSNVLSHIGIGNNNAARSRHGEARQHGHDLQGVWPGRGDLRPHQRQLHLAEQRALAHRHRQQQRGPISAR